MINNGQGICIARGYGIIIIIKHNMRKRERAFICWRGLRQAGPATGLQVTAAGSCVTAIVIGVARVALVHHNGGPQTLSFPFLFLLLVCFFGSCLPPPPPFRLGSGG
ncbi:hypothetical protein B0T24DRAFT_607595 [Lasiosphaeria ovina]|uniref:Uncharacterized protein n=1 Tax=Lasiosphaeria ovina TaxID=92902 RepID=A0AAE0TYF3_9PEZI|nr:hypothetical protein B0T24DRAFT_607595 [Lasiosphaeria ovina]